MAAVIGVDLGGTKIRAGLATQERSVVAEIRRAIVSTSRPGLIAQLREICAELADRQADGGIAAVGIGAAGAFDSQTGAFSKAPNLAGMVVGDFAGELEEAIGAPVVLENDVNVAAIGELRHGAGLGTDSFGVIAVGTGIGMGLVYRGELLRGVTGAAGEVGYLPFGGDPFAGYARSHGAMEEVVSGGALRSRVRGAQNAAEVFERAAGGEPAAVSALSDEARWIALTIAAVESVLNLRTYVLTGGVGSRAELEPLVLEWLDRLDRRELTVGTTRLGERAAILGAVELALAAPARERKAEK